MTDDWVRRGLISALTDSNAYLVHGIGMGVGALSANIPIIERYEAAIQGSGEFLYCATVKTGDGWPSQGFFTTNGIIVKPKKLVFALPQDGGSDHVNNSEDFKLKSTKYVESSKDEELRDAISGRGLNKHNEIVLSEYDAVALYMDRNNSLGAPVSLLRKLSKIYMLPLLDWDPCVGFYSLKHSANAVARDRLITVNELYTR